MKRTLDHIQRVSASVLLVACWVLCANAEPTTDKEQNSKPAESVDVREKVKEWNSGRFAPPPTEFRKGNVTAKQLDPKSLTKTAGGFTVQLPSKAPVPTPSIYEGRLFVSGGFHSKEFYCFHAENGALVWGVSLDDDGPTAAVCSDGVIVFNTESCTIFALESDTGKQLWSYWLGDPLTSTPTIAKGRVFTSYPAASRGGQSQNSVQQIQNANTAQEKPAGGNPAPPCSHALAAFDLKTGKILWQRWLDSDVMSAPIAVDQELYVTSFAGIVYKFNQANGEILSATRSRATSAPVVAGANVYYTKRADDGQGKVQEAIASYNRDLSAQNFEGSKKEAVYLDQQVQLKSSQKGAGMKLDAANGFGGGAPVQANSAAALSNIGQDNVSTMQAFQGSRLLWMNDRNFNCMGDEVVCTSPSTGKTLWTFKLEGDLKKEGGCLAAPPAAAGGQLFLATLNGNVLQMDPVSGKIVKTYNVGSQLRFQPAIESGRIYVGTQDGQVVCIDSGDKSFAGWPCWGGNPAHTGLAQATGN